MTRAAIARRCARSFQAELLHALHPQIRLVDEGGRAEGEGPLAAQLAPGEGMNVLVEVGEGLLEGLAFPLGALQEQRRHLGIGIHPVGHLHP
jgi:hypothetical protein